MINLEYFINKIPNFFSYRGIKEIKGLREYLNPSLKLLQDPFLLNSMDKTVDRILSNDSKKPILIYGDCDADGVSGTALLYKYLCDVGYNIDFYIPKYNSEGHSLSKKAIEYIKSIGGNLIITCDLGMSSNEEINYANNIGIDVIVTDHHKSSQELPESFSIINPWLSSSNLKFRDLSGSVVAFKLCQAINIKLGFSIDKLDRLMILATLGIISDKVSINRDNRYISQQGYKKMSKDNNLGLYLLNKKIVKNSNRVDFNKLIRMINMVIKLGDPNVILKLLTSDNPIQITKYVNIVLKKFKKESNSLNSEVQLSLRKAYTQDYKKNKCIFITSDSSPSYNGVIANILLFRFSVPVIVMSVTNQGEYKGSFRGFKNIDILPFLISQKNNLVKFGGHSQAAGFLIKKDNISRLKEEFHSFVKNQNIKNVNDLNKINDLVSFQDINLDMLEFIESFEPFGKDNEPPRFKSKGVKLFGKPNIINNSHESIKFTVEQNNLRFEALGLGLINKFEKLITEDKLNIEFTILRTEVNKIILNVYDIN
tara:strand:- start:5812 stop:7428 length:1617 start_codon:yes stop_codon:yes gene_type:complete